MGILNITPDSFYDGNPSLNEDFFIKSLDDLTNADIIDIGCESSRPGANPINDEEEIRRLEIILPYLSSMQNIKLSIDTYKPKVAKYALLNGFSIINDIKAGAESLEMFEVASSSKSQIILMHMKGNPRTMQNNPHYDNIIDEISSFLEYRAAEAVKYGISEENIIIDPGIGFGKTFLDNMEIIRKISEFKKLGFKILLGHSRKSFLMQYDDTPNERLSSTIAVSVFASMNKVDILRVHDVYENKKAINTISSLIK